MTPYILVEMWLYFEWDYSLHRYAREGGGSRPFRNIYKFLPSWTISNISRVCFIKPPFTLVRQTLSQLYNGSGFKYLIYSVLVSLRVSGTWIIVSRQQHSIYHAEGRSVGKMRQFDCVCGRLFNEAKFIPNDASNNSHHSASNGNENRE